MRACLLAALLAAATSSTDAGKLLYFPPRVAPSLDGGAIFTFSILAEEGETFRGFDFSYEGPLNQQLAAGMSTPFTNFDAFLPDGGAEDSKFLLASGDVLSIGVEESPNSLKGAISGLAQLGLRNPAEFARIVVPSHKMGTVNIMGTYRIAVDLGGSQPQLFNGALFIPEPASCLLASLALVGLATREVPLTRRRVK